jgi:uncharacterized protein YdhG (YjbR/CyaY superfamily)
MTPMKAFSDVDAYLADQSSDVRVVLEKIRRAVKATAPAATEKISYGIPTFDLDRHRLVYYAAFRNHCSFFPASTAVMREFANELADFEVSKGTIRFTVDHPIPIPLVKRIVKARIQEERARRAKRG